jgi:hypothetical protein
MKPLALNRWDVQDRFPSEAGAPLVRLDWYTRVRAAIDDARNVVCVILTPRQAGKTVFLMSLGAATLLSKTGAYIVLVLPSAEQARALTRQKLHRPLHRLAKQLGIEASLKFTALGVTCMLTHSTFEIVPSTEFTSLGRSTDLLLIDEGKGIPDAVFESLLPSIIGVGGQVVVTSSAGRPTGWLYNLVQHPGDGIFVHRETENTNPRASSRVLATIERLFSWFNPAARERELHAEFQDDGTEFLSPALIEAAVDDSLTEWSHSGGDAFVFYDLARRRDLCSRVVVVRLPSRHPERLDHLVAASIRVWDPKASATGEVDFAEVRGDLGELPTRFRNLRKVLVDGGAEAGSVMGYARAHPNLSLLVEEFRATAESNMKLWGALSGRLHDQSLTIPCHERLLGELRSLRTAMFASGGWKVTDSSRRWHRDVSLSLAGACLAAGTVAPYRPARLWMSGDPPSDPDAEVREWAAEREVDRQDLLDRIRRGGGAYLPGIDG